MLQQGRNRVVSNGPARRTDRWQICAERCWLWLEQYVSRWMPGYCALCLDSVACGVRWCRRCFEELPHLLHGCYRCGEPLPVADGMLCGRCLRSPPPFAVSWVVWRYEGDIARMVQRFKFRADRRAGHLLTALLDHGLKARGFEAECDVLIPVPLHPARARERGFDQTAWLARSLAARRGWQMVKAERTRWTPSQRELERRERLRNVPGAFRVVGMLPETVMLLDDVMTTGATLSALADACRRAGAQRIIVLALARTPANHG